MFVGGGVTGAGIALDAAAPLTTAHRHRGDGRLGLRALLVVLKLVGGLPLPAQLHFSCATGPLEARPPAEHRRAAPLVLALPVAAQAPLSTSVPTPRSALSATPGPGRLRGLDRRRSSATWAQGTSRPGPLLDTSGLAGSIRFFDARV